LIHDLAHYSAITFPGKNLPNAVKIGIWEAGVSKMANLPDKPRLIAPL
jgi:hypothetical protein